MVRIYLGIATLIAGFYNPKFITLYIMMGLCLIISGLFDGGYYKICNFHFKKRSLRDQEIMWIKRFGKTTDNKELIHKFATKMIDKNVKVLTIKPDRLCFDDREVTFHHLKKRNLDEVGCKVLAHIIKKDLEKMEITNNTLTKCNVGYQIERNEKDFYW